MLKTRIIPTLLIQNSSVVKTINFNNPRIVGDAFSTAKVFSERMADEMIIVDINAHKRNTINSQLFKKISNDVFSYMGYFKILQYATYIRRWNKKFRRC